jgi:DNA polymerase III subunit beta
MKVRVGREVLAEAVGWVARGLPGRPTVPILAGMVVEAGDGQVTLSGFDYESSGRVSVPAEVADDGRFLVSGRLLSDICRRRIPDAREQRELPVRAAHPAAR